MTVKHWRIFQLTCTGLIILLAVLHVVGVFGKPEVSTFLDKERNWLEKYKDENTIGKTYGKYLVGTYGEEVNSNQNWWNWKYKLFQQDQQEKGSSKRNFSEDFLDLTKVTQGFSGEQDKDTVSTSLNKVCERVYLKNVSEINSQEVNDPKFKLKEDLWRYCTVFSYTPVTVNKDEESAEAYSKSDNGTLIGKSKENYLLSTKHLHNKNLWIFKDYLFFNLSESEVEGEFFKEFYKSEKEEYQWNRKTLAEKCEEAYEQVSLQESAVVKHCSLLGKEVVY